MSEKKVKVGKSDEVYFKTTTNYELEVDGKPLTIRLEEDSNEGVLWYLHDEGWSESPPDWIVDLGEDEWGSLKFESLIWESSLSGCVEGEELIIEE